MGTLTLLAAAVSLTPALQDAKQLKTYLLKDARVVVRPGRTLDRADILIRDGKIAEVGQGLRAAGAEVIDCDGLTAYPGFVYPMLRLRLDDAAPSTSGMSPTELAERRDGDPFGIADNLLSGKQTADLEDDEVATFGALASSGYGVANVSASAGLLGTASAVYSLAGTKLGPDSVLNSPNIVPVSFSRSGGGGFGSGYPGSTMGGIAFVRQAFLDAQRYGRLLASGKKPEDDPGLAALLRATKGDALGWFDELNETTFYQARAVASEFGLKPVFGFRSGVGAVVGALGKDKPIVVLRGEMPEKPQLGEDLSSASIMGVRAYFNEVQAGATLEKAGVEFLYSPRETNSALEGIRTYVRGGLSRDAALASMTTNPAHALGIEGQVGTIEAGKLGNVVLVQGDLFNSSSQVMAVFAGGVRVTDKMPERKAEADLKLDEPLPVLPPNYDLFPRPAETWTSQVLYKNATIWTMGPQGVLRNADLLVQSGKVVKVGSNLEPPAGVRVVDATGKHISPGVWDCHSHTGVSGSVNEGSQMITVQCRIGDVIDHRAIGIYRQLSGGTVGANQLHGSANAIGGQNSSVKWRWGEPPTAFPVEGAPPGVKFALGQNPIREPAGRGGGEQAPEGQALLTWRPQTRMGVEESIRRALQLGVEYAAEWQAYRDRKVDVEPRRDLQLEGLAEIAAGKRVIHSHGYRSDEMLGLIRVAKEFGAKINTLQHVLEGYKIADEMAAAGVGGSTFADWWGYKLEAYDAVPFNAAIMANRGVSVSINSDSDNHARRLNHEAAKSIRYGGLTPEKALSFVTIEPARQMGIDAWTGSLEPGKDADFVVWSAGPTSMFAVCLETYVDGIKRFDRVDDARQREERLRELELARSVLNGGAANGGALSPGTEAKEEPAEAGKARFGLGPVTGVAGSMKYPRTAVWFRGATVHPMTGDPFVGDVIIGPDGKISYVGPQAEAAVSANIVDAAGMHLYPGLIDPSTTLGINEIGQVPVSDDSSEKGDFHPDYLVERTINQDWETLAVARHQGVLTAVVRPAGQGIAGQAALIHTEGYTWEDLTVQGSIALAVSMGGGRFGGFEDDDGHADHDEMAAGIQGPRGQGGAGQGGYTRLSRQLGETKEYLEKRKAATPEKPVALDARYEALSKALDGTLPFLIPANSASDIREAVAWAEKEGVRVFLYGGSGAGEIADWLAEKNIPIALSSVFGMPDADRPTEYFYSLPSQLKKAGVRFCLTTNSAHDVRQLRDMAGFAAAFGLDREDAVRSITLWTAELLGLGDRLGAIRPGFEGTVFLTDGDVLETSTKVLRAWIGGREVGLENRQTRLADRYANRPLPIRR